MQSGGYRSYKITDAAGVLKFRAVVQGANGGEVAKPGGANADKLVGVTQEDQATQNKNVLVKESGRTYAVAAGAIAVGDAVNIADNTGKFQSCQAAVAAGAGAFATTYVSGRARTAAGADGDIFELEIQPFVVKTPAS